MFTVVVPEGADRFARAVEVLLEGRDGTLWVGTLKGLHRLERDGGGYALRHVEMGMPGEWQDQRYVLDLLEDRHGSLWVATGHGLYRRRPDGTVSHYTARDGLPSNYFHDLLEDRRGRLWAGTRDGGFFQLVADDAQGPPAVVRSYAARDGLTTDWVAHLFESSDGRFWVATNKGLAEFFPDAGEREPKFKTYTQRNGLLHYGLVTLGEDAGGNLWLGSDAGAMKLARDGLTSYGERDGLFAVYAIFGDRAGGVCFRAQVFGDERRSVFEGAKPDPLRPLENWHNRYGRFDGERFTWLKPDSLDNNQLGWVGEMVTLQARNGEWWLGTGEGVYRFPATDDFAQLKRARPLAIYTNEAGLPAVHRDGRAVLQVYRLFEDSRGDIWVSATGPRAFARWEREAAKWHDLRNAPGAPPSEDDIARSFGEDRHGNIWVGFSTGAARYRDGRFDFFGAAEGMPPGRIQHVYSDAAGRLWLASSRSGLVRVDDPGAERPVFRAYTTAEGLSSDNVEVVTEDLQGRIYVGTGRGLDRLDPATGHVQHFTTAEGLAPGAIKAAFRASDGTLWVGTSKGLSRLAPGTDDESAQPPPILITALSVAGERQVVSALGETEISLPDLAADRNQLQIDFVGLSFAPGEVLRYQYKLEGSDAEWSAPNEQRTVNFASLAPGQYRFMVRAVNSDGLASLAPATITFRVLRPFWQRPWFVALAALALAALAFAAYRYRVRRLLELERVRTRIATDLHDDIGANLTKIAILSEVAKQQRGNGEEDADGPLSAIARISRESASSMSDIVWAINPRRDRLLDLVRRMRQHAEELFALRDIELSFDVADAEQNLGVGIDVRRDLLLIFKEAVNNAARHSGCTRVEIRLSVEESWLHLLVRDDGAGFDPSAESDGEGLANMRQRAEKLGGSFKVESRPGQGVAVSVRIPLARSRAFS